MPIWTEKRQANASKIDACVADLTVVRRVVVPEYIEHAEYKHYMFIRPEHLAQGWDRDRIVNTIVERGVPCFQGSCSEVYLEKAFDGTGLRPKERLKNAKELGETSLMFLVHPTLKQQEVDLCCEALSSVMRQASKEINL